MAFVAWFFGLSLRSAWLQAMKRRSWRRAKWDFCNRTVRRLRPFYAAVQRACMEETCIMFARNRNFYEIMATLEAHRDTLSKSCRQTAFSGTLQQPNSLIFTKVATVTVNLGPELGSGLPVLRQKSIGYVGAPLMYSTPGHTAIYRTWFLIFEAKTQPPPPPKKCSLSI